MPAVSKAQQHLFGLCYGAMKAGKGRPAKCPKVSMKVAKEFAATKTKGLPGRARKRS